MTNVSRFVPDTLLGIGVRRYIIMYRVAPAAIILYVQSFLYAEILNSDLLRLIIVSYGIACSESCSLKTVGKRGSGN